MVMIMADYFEFLVIVNLPLAVVVMKVVLFQIHILQAFKLIMMNILSMKFMVLISINFNYK
jgi:hypothetical protein